MSPPGHPGAVRVGIVGCGRIVERGYLPAARGLDGVEIVALADRDAGRLADCRALAQAAGEATAGFVDAAAMLDAGGLDALVVATPADGHVELATLAARAGLPCLIEKPPATDLAGAAALTALDPAPWIGFNRRFLQGAALAPLVPAEGWLELDLVLRFQRGGWGAHQSRDEALLDAGTHLIDLAAFLADSDPIAVRGADVGPERASLELELTRGRARIACATDRRYAERVHVRDRSGSTIAASTTNGWRARLARLRGGEDPLVGSLRRQLECFAAATRGEDPGTLANARAGRMAMAVVEAARRSAELGGAEVAVAIPAVEPA